MPTPMEEYLFDLHGYTVIKGALDPDHLRAMNNFLDALPQRRAIVQPIIPRRPPIK